MRYVGTAIVLCILALFLFIFFSKAASASDYRIAFGSDVVHDAGTPFFLADIHQARVMSSPGTGLGVGAVYSVSLRGWGAGLGGVILEKTGDINGTNLNFLMEAGYTFGKYSIRVTHISNGKKLGIGPDDKPNDGWNIISLGINF